MTSAFMRPRPCSALMLPRCWLVHSYTKGSISASTSGVYSLQETLRCRFPSPRCPYPTTLHPPPCSPFTGAPPPHRLETLFDTINVRNCKHKAETLGVCSHPVSMLQQIVRNRLYAQHTHSAH